VDVPRVEAERLWSTAIEGYFTRRPAVA
jgi:hypothetical protein